MTTLTEFIPILSEKTMNGSVVWEDIGGGSFYVSLGGATIEIGRKTGIGTYLTLRNADGVSLESVNYQALVAPFDAQLSEIYALIHRKALKVDETLAAVKQALDSLK